MKKNLLFLLIAVFLLSCGKEIPPADGGDTQPLTFLLDATWTDASKAVQTDWEKDNVIFVFFDNVSTPNYLEMKYDGSSWHFTEKNGSLGLVNGQTGTMRAVYLPFGSDATISADGTKFKFSKTTASFYLTAQENYSVQNNTISGNFKMSVPDGYVQFYVEDANAVDGGYKLATDAVRPVEIVSVTRSGNIYTGDELAAGGNMTGYAYKGGYVFSGVLVNSYAYKGDYYFAKTKVSDGSRADYFVTGKTALKSRDSRKLPANGNAKWKPVGASKTVTLSTTVTGTTTNYGVWYTCNQGATKPEDPGTRMDYATANALVGDYKLLPEPLLIDNIISSLTWTPMSVHGKPGVVVSAGDGFLLFPVSATTQEEFYWSHKLYDANHAYHLYVKGDGSCLRQYSHVDREYLARYLYAEAPES